MTRKPVWYSSCEGWQVEADIIVSLLKTLSTPDEPMVQATIREGEAENEGAKGEAK